MRLLESEAELRRLRLALNEAESRSASAPPDNLEEIFGIGPVFAGRLHEAGVHRFADLAALTPEQVRAHLGEPRDSQRADAERWIDEARQRVQSDTS